MPKSNSEQLKWSGNDVVSKKELKIKDKPEE